MLPKKNRLTTRELASVMEKGRVTHSPFFIMRSVAGTKGLKISAVVPVKVAKTAHLRNRTRREMYKELESIVYSAHAVSAIFPSLFHAVIFAKKNADSPDFSKARGDIRSLFVKAGLLV